MIVKRNGDVWSLDAIDDDDVLISKNGKIIVEYAGGRYTFKELLLTEAELSLIIDMIYKHKENVRKK